MGDEEAQDDGRGQGGEVNGKQHPPASRHAAADDEHNAADVRFKAWIADKMDWSWFTCTQSTGGVAVLLSESPKQFFGLQTIGTVLFILNLVLFCLFTGLMFTRWIVRRGSFKSSFIRPPECFFYGSFWLSIATIILCMQRFAQPVVGGWLVVAIRVLFWIYAAATLLNTTVALSAIAQYTPFTALEMHPAVFLTVYNAMLTGTVASGIAVSQPPVYRLPIIVAGIAFQGLGFLSSFLLMAMFVARLLQNGWPPPSQRPGLFMTVGAPGFTMVALIGNARALPQGYAYFATHPDAAEILQVVATWVCVFLWLFTFWLFGLAAVISLAGVVSFKHDGDNHKNHNASKSKRIHLPMTFDNAWWAMIFPNVGFTLGTVYLGQEFGSQGIQWVSVAMILGVVVFWLLDLVLMGKMFGLSLLKHRRRKRA